MRKKAGFAVDEAKLKAKLPFGEAFNDKAMEQIFGNDHSNWIIPNSLDEYQLLFEKAIIANRQSILPSSTKGKNLFDADDEALLNDISQISSFNIENEKWQVLLTTGIGKYPDQYSTNVKIKLTDDNKLLKRIFTSE